jgi:hypothetical protein
VEPDCNAIVWPSAPRVSRFSPSMRTHPSSNGVLAPLNETRRVASSDGRGRVPADGRVAAAGGRPVRTPRPFITCGLLLANASYPESHFLFRNTQRIYAIAILFAHLI